MAGVRKANNYNRTIRKKKCSPKIDCNFLGNFIYHPKLTTGMELTELWIYQKGASTASNTRYFPTCQRTPSLRDMGMGSQPLYYENLTIQQMDDMITAAEGFKGPREVIAQKLDTILNSN
jgi:hypothetical protein